METGIFFAWHIRDAAQQESERIAGFVIKSPPCILYDKRSDYVPDGMEKVLWFTRSVHRDGVSWRAE